MLLFTKFLLDNVKHEPSKKPTDPAIKVGLLQYRFKLSEQFCDPNAVQLVVLDMATGLIMQLTKYHMNPTRYNPRWTYCVYIIQKIFCCKGF